MKIGINALSAKTGGGATYLKNLVPMLAEVGEEHEYYIIIPKGEDRVGVKKLSQANVKGIEVRVPNVIIRLLKEQFLLPFLLWRSRIDLLFSPANITSLLAPCKVVLLIQSINPYVSIKRSSTYQKIRLQILRTLSTISVKKACKVVFLSNYSRRLVSRKMKIDSSKTATVYLGVNIQQFSSRPSSQPPAIPVLRLDKYILSVSSIAEHKNYEVLIMAYSNLSKSLLNEYKLVIVGETMQKNYYDKLLGMVTERRLREKVKFLGQIDHFLLPQIYREASLLVLPSLIENFSFTLLEAMAGGAPVVASDSTAILEQVGDAALLFNPSDPDELRVKIEQVLSDSKLRDELIQKGLKRAKLFSWEKCAKEILTVFKEACEANKKKR